MSELRQDATSGGWIEALGETLDSFVQIGLGYLAWSAPPARFPAGRRSAPR